MISKEKFVEYLNFIDSLTEREIAFNEGLSKCFGDQNVANIFVYSDIVQTIIKMLCDLMEIEYNSDSVYGDDITYFIYERDFGRLKGSDECISEIIDGKEIKYDISSPEKLYDYIVSQKKDNKSNEK